MSVALVRWRARFGGASQPALGFVLGSALALSRAALQPALGDKSPFIMAAPAMMVAAFIGGFWPTVAVSAVALYIGESALTSQGARPPGGFGLLVYLLFTLAFATAGGMRKRGLRRQRADADRMVEMQAQLAQTSRLNAMGEMAGTLAHELNQPLTAIASYAGAANWLVRDEARETPEVSELLGKIEDQALRAREIIRRIRSYVTGVEVEPRPCALPDLVREAAALALEGNEGRPVLRYAFEADAQWVLADRIQIQQVIINLVRNASEAMQGSARPSLRIGSRSAGPNQVEIEVADNGPGIDPAVAQGLFQPFVTNKPSGTGIGLAISRSIVEAHGGRIWAEAGSTGGTVFRFTVGRAEAGK